VTGREVFPNPPIIEALLDLQVILPKTIDIDNLKSFQDNISDQFPGVGIKKKWEGKVELKLKEGKAPEISAPAGNQTGWFFTSSDKKRVVQARLDGFTYSKLKPYDKWDKLKSEAEELWESYCEIAEPLEVKRVALRYINQIELPLPFSDFKEYLLTTPEIAPNIPQELVGYLMRLVIPHKNKLDIAIVIQEMKPISENGNLLPIIFDIDVFRNIKLDPQDSQIWEILEELREFKNDIFFNSITSKTKELFK